MVRDSETVFLLTIDPPLAGGDLPLVLARLRASWPPERLLELLASPLEPVVTTAAACLGLTGSMQHCGRLTPLLAHRSEQIASAAEQALWRIWMRAGSAGGNAELARAVRSLRDGKIEAALEQLRALTAAEETFAEAHHQQALVLHLLERYEQAEGAYQATLALNPDHFAAVTGLGHVRIQRGDLIGALRHYRRALEIHPGLAEIREVIPQLEQAVKKRIVA